MEKLIWALVLGAAFYFAWWTTQRPAKPQTTPAIVSSTSTAPPIPINHDSSDRLILDHVVSSVEPISLSEPGRGPLYYPDVDYALQKARETHKPLMIVVTSRSCPRTDTFVTLCNTYPVRPYYDRCVWCLVDLDDQTRTLDLVSRCKAMQTSFQVPAVLAFTTDGIFQSRCSPEGDALLLGRFLEQVAGK